MLLGVEGGAPEVQSAGELPEGSQWAAMSVLVQHQELWKEVNSWLWLDGKRKERQKKGRRMLSYYTSKAIAVRFKKYLH